MRAILFTIAAVVLLTVPSVTCLATDYALVVGVNRCPKFKINGAAPKGLAGAEDDARDFAELLQKKYKFAQKNIVSMLGSEIVDNGPMWPKSEATHGAVEAAFKEFKKILHDDDQFVFYFAGHGTQIEDQLPYPGRYDEQNEDGLDEALCPSDACFEGDMAKKLIVDDELHVWLKELPASRIVVVLDTCHSGTGAMGANEAKIESRALPIVPPGIGRLPMPGTKPSYDLRFPGKTVIAIYACEAKQTAIERIFDSLPAPNNVRGQFTKTLIDNLQTGGANKPTELLADEVKSDLQKQAAIAAGSLSLQNSWRMAIEQNPTFEATGGGKSVLLEPATPVNQPDAKQAK